MTAAEALAPLLRDYARAAEGQRAALLRAMRAHDPVAGARGLFEGDAEARRMAVHLMELFPGDAHLPLLERALADGDDGVRARALRSLRLQWRTEAWEALLVRLLESPGAEVRAAAAALVAEQGVDVGAKRDA